MSDTYESVALGPEHNVSEFDCGNVSLNAWLAEQALRAQRAGTARTYVWVGDEESDRVWAYYSLAPTELARADLTSRQSSGYSTVPAYLLARLALHTHLHGQGHGGQVLVDAMVRAARAADAGGGRFLVVDAIDEDAASFYSHYDFTPVKGNPRRLVLKMASIRGLLE